MPQQNINIGTSLNDGTGDTIRDSFDKTNQNFTELYGQDVSSVEDTGNDLEVINPGSGLILESPDGLTRVRLTIDNAGILITTTI